MTDVMRDDVVSMYQKMQTGKHYLTHDGASRLHREYYEADHVMHITNTSSVISHFSLNAHHGC